MQQGDPEHPSRRLKSSADTKKCVRNALEEPVCNRFLVPAGRFNAPRGGDEAILSPAQPTIEIIG
jgi:hypothetical protein